MNGSRGLPMQDLVVALDDADGRMLYARFFPQEGTASTFAALESVVRTHGRFCELYTDRGSHFCQSRPAGEVAEEQHGQVSQALRALGIHQILARSPRARGRSERAFGTIQGRLPQELRHNDITDYDAANRYLQQHFIADFNRRFTVKPAQPESAFVKLAGVELELVLSSKHERVVRNDNTVTFKNLILQLPATRQRIHFVRCPVTVHQFGNGTLGISSAFPQRRRQYDHDRIRGNTENVKSWKTEVVAKIINALGLAQVMFEAAEPEVFSLYLKHYGPEVHMFIDHSQIVQLEALRSGLWATKDTWCRILSYKAS